MEKEDLKEDLEGGQSEETQEEQPNIKEKDPNAEEGAKAQTREENAKFAQMRRENERLRQEVEKLKKQNASGIYDKAVGEFGFDRNSLDDDDRELVKLYQEAIVNGESNPKEYAYSKYYDSKRATRLETNKRKAEEAEDKKRNDEALERDLREFRSKYSEDELKQALNPEGEFNKIYGSVITNGNFTKLYSIYKSNKGTDDAAKSKGVPSTSGKNPAYKEPEDINSLTNEEYEEWLRNHNMKPCYK